MLIHFYNTLTKQKEEFIPLNPDNVGMYVCGPTVYDRPHLGNARSVVVFDLLFRLLSIMYHKVTYVRNITDVDDKINKAAREREISIQELTTEITQYFHDDIKALHVLPPTIEAKATEHIADMIILIQKLIASGHAYVSEGHVLFVVDTFAAYGQLARRSTEEMIAGARVEVAPYKKNPMDFVLWKPASENDDPSSIFDSPWSKGRPGWHIECSAMSTKYLGPSYDIHGGGADLQFPHHENEIAQSKCAYPGSDYARYWLHNGFLTVNGEKMSKSTGNFITIRELLDKGIPGEAIRYVLLTTHYRKPLDFTEKALTDAVKVLYELHEVVGDSQANVHLEGEFLAALEDDLNTPEAIAYLHKKKKESGEGGFLRAAMEFLGVYNEDYIRNYDEQQKSRLTITNEEIGRQIALRLEARKNENWDEADRIREELKQQGVVLEDHVDGSTSYVLEL